MDLVSSIYGVVNLLFRERDISFLLSPSLVFSFFSSFIVIRYEL